MNEVNSCRFVAVMLLVAQRCAQLHPAGLAKITSVEEAAGNKHTCACARTHTHRLIQRCVKCSHQHFSWVQAKPKMLQLHKKSNHFIFFLFNMLLHCQYYYYLKKKQKKRHAGLFNPFTWKSWTLLSNWNLHFLLFLWRSGFHSFSTANVEASFFPQHIV